MHYTGSRAKLASKSVAAAAAAAPRFPACSTAAAAAPAAAAALRITASAATGAAAAAAAAANAISRVYPRGIFFVAAACRNSGSSSNSSSSRGGFGVISLLQQRRLLLTTRAAETPAATAAAAHASAATAAPAAASPAAGATAVPVRPAAAILHAALRPDGCSRSGSSSSSPDTVGGSSGSGDPGGDPTSSSSSSSNCCEVDSSMVDGWFRAIDANCDGLISQREFRTWYCLHFIPTFSLQQQQQKQQQLLQQQQQQHPQQQPQQDQPQQQPQQQQQQQQAAAGAALPAEADRNASLSSSSELSSSSSGCCLMTTQQQVQQRLVQLEAEAAALRSALQAGQEEQQQPLSSKLLLLIVVRSSIPYMGFGFMDNCLMLLFGELIDLQLGAALNLSTLAAAGLGNMVSCSSGVVTGGFIERCVYRLKWLPKARLSPRQAESTEARNAHLVGSVLGICIGCLLGLFPLLVMPNRRREEDEEEKHQEGDSSEEDSMPLGIKRLKQGKTGGNPLPPAAAGNEAAAAAAAPSAAADSTAPPAAASALAAAPAAASAAAAAAGASVKEEEKPAAPAAAAAKPVEGSLAAALKSVKSEGAKDAAAIMRPSSSQSPAGGRRRTNKFIKTEENFEPICRWWERDLSQIENNVWQYLEHNGLVFAPPYQPHGISIKYKGEEVSLPPAAEEVANFWCGILESDYASKIRFVRNFWRAFLSKLPADHPIKADPKHTHVRVGEADAAAAAAAAAATAAGEDPVAAAAKARAAAATAPDACGFEACDFTRIKQHLDALKEAKKNLSKEEKEAIKAQKDAEAAPFAFALVDWLREKVGNSKVEPPGLFRGRGEHPKQGMLKRRIFPEDVILNLAEDAPVPKAADMPGHCWKDIAHDCRVTWLAFYRDSINDQVKYMYLAAQSGFKGQQDFLKYEKARRLKHYVKAIREDYFKKMRSGDAVDRQLGTATYLIDFLALRVGGEKDTDEEADTVGCCSLRVEHTTLNSETEEVTFDFLGKDSIRYFNTVKIDSQAFKNLVAFCKGKKPDQDVFDRINSTSLNNHLKQLMPGLSAKMFRTYNASITLQQELQKLQPTLRLFKEELQQQQQLGRVKAKTKKVAKTQPDLVGAAVAAAATATAATTADEEGEGSEDAVKKEEEEPPVLDINLSDVNQLVQFYNDANRAVAILCNHQRSVPKQHAASMARLELQLRAIEEDLKELKAFQGHLKKNKGDARGFKHHSDFIGPKGEPRKPVVRENMKEDAVAKKIEQTEKRRQAHLLKMRMKDDNKTVALGTSKINYMDPRITVAFCKQFEVPIEKVFNKSLRLKFPWAMFAPSTFVF
ncbi:hypothetical protein Efla_007191 [Eimeria flavescens]